MSPRPEQGSRARIGAGVSPGSHRRIQQAVLIAGALVLSVWLGAGAAFLAAIVPPHATPAESQTRTAPAQDSMTLDEFERSLEGRIEAEILRTGG